ncbi:hypothetical protein [uncultured Gimesia sp.]|uniref:hypothetical protein n=1 Tax=uncultured Gimesia sp. TaxID=1678688 RepID=UPI0030D88E81|tara:strand:+ start:63444 stop:63971 length:528 start_codon:yes stop_codon:yes gene_type:complete
MWLKREAGYRRNADWLAAFLRTVNKLRFSLNNHHHKLKASFVNSREKKSLEEFVHSIEKQFAYSLFELAGLSQNRSLLYFREANQVPPCATPQHLLLFQFPKWDELPETAISKKYSQPDQHAAVKVSCSRMFAHPALQIDLLLNDWSSLENNHQHLERSCSNGVKKPCQIMILAN